jgi:hypothetical protein
MTKRPQMQRSEIAVRFTSREQATPPPLDQLLEAIAKKHLRIATLRPRNRDRLDFYDCGVVQIKDALEAAFKAGMEVGVALK